MKMTWIVLMGLCTVAGCTSSPPVGTADRADFTSQESEEALRRAEGMGDFLRLVSYFETQENTAYCGVATGVMLLNAIGVPRPLSEPHGGAAYYTQANFFSEGTERVLSSAKVRRAGMTLEEMAGALRSHNVRVDTYFADEYDIQSMRRIARDALSSPEQVVAVNYHRPAIGQPGPGHISPIAAYDAQTDQFLILDVSRYKHEPLWLNAEILWKGMRAVDGESGRSRGLLVVSRG